MGISPKAKKQLSHLAVAFQACPEHWWWKACTRCDLVQRASVKPGPVDFGARGGCMFGHQRCGGMRDSVCAW